MKYKKYKKMNNQTKQDYIKSEFSKNQNKNFKFHKIRMNNNGDIKINNIIRFFVIIIAFNIVFFFIYYIFIIFKNQKIISRKSKENLILILYY